MTARSRRRVTRVAPSVVVCLSLVVGYLLVFGPRVPAWGRPHLHGAFVAYRGHHHIGDMIGPDARVVAVDSRGDATAVVSTDGRPPVVWAFELADPSLLSPVHGRRVRFSGDPWVHRACPGPLCPAGWQGAHRPALAAPPPALPLHVCGALQAADLVPVLGPGPYSAAEPYPGSCVWDNGRAGVQIEVGGPPWWRYLAGLGGLYRGDPAASDELVDRADGLHIAVRQGPVVAVLLTYANPSISSWARIAREVATWSASR